MALYKLVFNLNFRGQLYECYTNSIVKKFFDGEIFHGIGLFKKYLRFFLNTSNGKSYVLLRKLQEVNVLCIG